MSKKYIKNITKNLIDFLEYYNFKYLEKKKAFIGSNDILVFRCSFDIGGYGSRLEFNLEFDCPVTKKHMNIFPEHFMRYAANSKNNKWIFDNFDIDFIVKDLKFVFCNYFYNLISKLITTYNLEEYIRDEYENRFKKYLHDNDEEDPRDIYTFEFINSGKSQLEWSKDDDEKCTQFRKKKQDEEFPYEKIRQEIMQDIENNQSEYYKTIETIFGEKSKKIRFDESIFGISAQEISKNAYIEKTIKDYGFNHNPTKNIQGLPNYGDTIYFQTTDSELWLIVVDELFLEFVFINNLRRKHIVLYDGAGFSFGWLIGKDSVRDENINNALIELEKVLNSVVA